MRITRRAIAIAIAIASAATALLLLIASAVDHWPPLTGAALADSPALTLTVSPVDNPLGPQIRLTAATSTDADAIASIDFQIAPATTQTWTSLGMNPTTAGSLPPYTVDVDTTNLTDGLYDLRAVLTDTAGRTTDSPSLRDRLVANNSPVVELSEAGATLATGSPLRATVPLHGVVLSSTAAIDLTTMSFQISPADREGWIQIARLATPASKSAAQQADFDFDTTAVPDGAYDLRAVPTDDQGTDYPTIPVRGVVVDNTPPTVSLADPGSPLQGSVTLTTQVRDAGSGVASVQFERSKAGSGAWQRIGMVTRAPFAHGFDATTWDGAAFELRALATDKAGNVAISNVVTATTANAAVPPPMPPHVNGVAVPAHNLTMLGSVSASPEHEAWAYGFTSAPPASVGGQPLPYTAEGDQFVLLRYTDASGWQVADVLRTPDGSAFRLLSPDATAIDGVQAVGRMTGSGESWLWIHEPSTKAGTNDVVGLFHRRPGGAFVLDPAATQAVGSPLLSTLTPTSGLRLGETAGGQEYGILVAPSQPATATQAAGAGGTSVTITARLAYALLANGAWTRATATLPAAYTARSGDAVTLTQGDVDGPDTGWGALSVERPVGTPAALPLLLGRFNGGQWQYVGTGLDALDLSGSVAGSVRPTGLKADGSAVWIGADVATPTATKRSGGGPVVARYDGASGRVTNSWCTLPVDNSCDQPLDLDHPAAVPDAIFGSVALSLQHNVLDVFARGQWTGAPTPGYSAAHGDTFSGPGDGWLGGESALGQVSSNGTDTPLASWPIADRAPLTSIALPPGTQAGLGESGALAVGLSGASLEYDASAGWVVAPTPQRAHHINLAAVAFAGPSSAFAIGQFGVILHWDGSTWAEDPQSISLTQSALHAIAFRPSGEGWAVGADGTILHYDGQSWSLEQPPAADAATDVTSVAVAGGDVFAIAGGNLIERNSSDGIWRRADPSLLPGDPAPVAGDLRIVSGLPDGGAVIAGRSVVLVRQHAGDAFAYSNQPLEGIAVAVAAFRDGETVRAAISVAPPAADSLAPFAPTRDIGGFPAGDGELLIGTANGWRDLSRAQFAGTATDLPPDGAVKPDPVLAVATSPDGQHAWVVGGYAGTPASSGLGTAAVLPARPAGWQTASLWRYDAGGSGQAPAVGAATPELPANPGTVSFAFFSGATCRIQCAATDQAQPDMNLAGAIGEISSFAAQPGGPAFAILGGNARGPLDPLTRDAGIGAIDFARLPDLLAPLTVPLFAAFGPLDSVAAAGQAPDQPWSDAFAGAPAPFGNGTAPAGIAPVASGAPAGTVSHYYSFDASQNGGWVRVIVIDNSKGSLDRSAVGQSDWLDRQLSAASGMATVVVAPRPLSGGITSDGSLVAARLVSAGVLAVFTGADATQLNERHDIPDNADVTIPEYEGATLGYQQPKNNGVVWYDVSVDTQAAKVTVDAVPVIQSLSLEPLGGLNVARSLTLQFQAIGRRPQGSLATAPEFDDSFAGFDSYVEIPAPSCGDVPCVKPTYAFASSDPTIGNFVTPSGPGSPVPKLDGRGRPIADRTSGLFCAFNAGTTTVSVTAGLLSYSLPVTVRAGGFGAPCGTVARAGQATQTKRTQPAPSGAPAPATPPPATATAAPAPLVKLPAAPAPAPAPQHAPAPHAPAPAPVPVPVQPPALVPFPPVVPVIVPPATPVQPIPPGGATAPSASSARAREKARKHASQSAFTTLTPGRSGYCGFYWAVGASTLLALMLTAQGLRPRRRPAPAVARVERDRR